MCVFPILFCSTAADTSTTTTARHRLLPLFRLVEPVIETTTEWQRVSDVILLLLFETLKKIFIAAAEAAVGEAVFLDESLFVGSF